MTFLLVYCEFNNIDREVNLKETCNKLGKICIGQEF